MQSEIQNISRYLYTFRGALIYAKHPTYTRVPNNKCKLRKYYYLCYTYSLCPKFKLLRLTFPRLGILQITTTSTMITQLWTDKNKLLMPCLAKIAASIPTLTSTGWNTEGSLPNKFQHVSQSSLRSEYPSFSSFWGFFGLMTQYAKSASTNFINSEHESRCEVLIICGRGIHGNGLWGRVLVHTIFLPN